MDSSTTCGCLCLQVQKQELERQVRYEAEKVSAMTSDRDRLQSSLTVMQERLARAQTERDTEKLLSREHKRQSDTAVHDGKQRQVNVQHPRLQKV